MSPAAAMRLKQAANTRAAAGGCGPGAAISGRVRGSRVAEVTSLFTAREHEQECPLLPFETCGAGVWGNPGAAGGDGGGVASDLGGGRRGFHEGSALSRSHRPSIFSGDLADYPGREIANPFPIVFSASVGSPVRHENNLPKDGSEVSEKKPQSAEFSSAIERARHPASFSASTLRAEITDRVQEIIRISPGDSVKARVRAAAQVLGLTFSRVEDYRYGEVRRIEVHEADQIRALSAEAKRRRLAELEAEYKALGKRWLTKLLMAWAGWFHLRSIKRK